MKCLCGRTHTSWRDWLFVAVITLALGSLLRAERERHEYRHAVMELKSLAAQETLVLDSLKALPCVVPGTIR